jgi:hypothetical protein
VRVTDRSTSLQLTCACGKWRATLDASSEAGQHATCYCDDCQAYARFLGRDDSLDDCGGTEVVQTWPARLSVVAGQEQLRLMRLTEKGLHRWFAGCCRSPIANTLGRARLPFVGVMVRRVVPEQREEVTRVFGTAIGAMGKFAPGGCPPGVLPTVNASLIARTSVWVARGFWRGAHRPTPFFDEMGRPIVPAQVLAPEERAALAQT